MTTDSWAYTSRWRRVHAAEKALFCAGCVIAALLSHSPVVPFVVVVLCTALAVASARVPLRAFARAALIPSAFVLWSGVAIAVSLRSPGAVTPAGSLVIGPILFIAPESVQAATMALSRSLAALAAVMLFAFTTPMTDTIALLRALRVPALLLDIMSLVYRQIFVFDETLARVRRAQSSRLGFVDRRAMWRSIGFGAGHLLAATLTRSQRATQGLLARGYEGELRYLQPDLAISARNLAMGGAASVALIAAAYFIGG